MAVFNFIISVILILIGIGALVFLSILIVATAFFVGLSLEDDPQNEDIQYLEKCYKIGDDNNKKD